MPITSGDTNHYKFTGKERESESGLDNFGARYDSSALGRFMTPDWSSTPTGVPYADMGNPQSLNLYSYTENNPTTMVDLNGHCDVGNEHHGWLWCAAHAFGFTETKKEKAADAAQNEAEFESWQAGHPGGSHVQFTWEHIGASLQLMPGVGEIGAGEEAVELIQGATSAASVPQLGTFTETTIEEVIENSARPASSEITEGARAIAKKAGHAAAEGTGSAFSGISATQENAASAIRKIMTHPARVVRGGRTTDIYNALGQGVRIENGTNRFIGFLEASKATR